MKRLFLLFIAFISIVSFGQDLKYSTPKRLFNRINNSTKGTFNILNYEATNGGTECDVDAINAAITAANAYSRGKVYIPAGAWYINDSIQAKSGVEVYADANAFFTVAPGYTGPVITTYGERVQDFWFKGGYFYGSTQGWDFVRLYSNGSYEQVINHFVENKVYGARRVFDVRLYSSGAWCNANQFHNIIAWNPVRFISVYDGVQGGLGFDGNQFSNIVIQTNSSADTVIHICGDNNRLDNVYVWDLDAGQLSFYFNNKADGNSIDGALGDNDSYWKDEGYNNRIVNKGHVIPYTAYNTYQSK